WPFTESVPPEVMYTISAEARVDAPARQAQATNATRTALGTCIGTNDPSTWLADCPESLQSSPVLAIGHRGQLPRYFGSTYVWKTRMPSSRGSGPPGLNVLSTSIESSTMSADPSCAAVSGNVTSVGALPSAAN